MLRFSDLEKEWQWRGVGKRSFPCQKVVGSSVLATCWQRGGKGVARLRSGTEVNLRD